MFFTIGICLAIIGHSIYTVARYFSPHLGLDKWRYTAIVGITLGYAGAGLAGGSVLYFVGRYLP